MKIENFSQVRKLYLEQIQNQKTVVEELKELSGKDLKTSWEAITIFSQILLSQMIFVRVSQEIVTFCAHYQQLLKILTELKNSLLNKKKINKECIVQFISIYISQTFILNIFLGVKICNQGIWEEIIVDDRIPVRGRTPMYSRGNGNELWVLLLEKAWAKLYGSYG